MSQIKVNSIIPAGGLPSGANGGIIQVVHAKKTDTFTSSTNNWESVPGLSAAITMSNASNKVLVITCLSCMNTGTSGSMSAVKRGSSFIGIPESGYGNRQNGSGASIYHDRADVFRGYTYTTLDAPGAGTHTYQVVVHPIGHTVKVNRSNTDNDNNAYARGTSELLLMEVAT